jgi:hypothetical protein
VGVAFLIGFVLLIVPGLIVLTFLAVVVPVIVLERTGVIEAFGRSIELVRGNAFQVFGVIAVIFLLRVIVGQAIQALAKSLSDSFAGYAVSDLLLQLLVAPLSALAAAVLFFELKALHGEPVLGTGAGGQVTAVAEPAPPPPPEAPLA